MMPRYSHVLLVSVLAASWAAAAEPRPWQAELWRPAVGEWRAEGSEYVQANERLYGAWSLWQGGRYRDVDVRVRFRISPAGSGVRAAGIVFRAVDAHHFFYAHFDSKNNQLLITRWSTQSRARHLARIGRIGLKQGVWHTARVHCVGTRARVYLDGRLLGQAEGVAEVSGQVGLRAGQGRVRFADWQVSGSPAAAPTPRRPAPWWNAAWRWRVPVDVREPGVDDRTSTLTTVRVDFGGRACVLGGAPKWTDVAVVDSAGRRVPGTLIAFERRGGGAWLKAADIELPVRVGWCQSSRYHVYFGNPKAPRPQREEVSQVYEQFGWEEGRPVPSGWRAVGGSWRAKALARPERNRSVVAAVKSQRHVAFPGICRTQKGTLLVVYREGYSHASGNPDDGRVMLARSTDLGKTWAAPELVADDPAMDDRNASIASMADGTLCVLWDKYLRGRHHWAWMATSRDDGRTWSKPLKVSQTENVHTRSRVLDLGSGRWLIPYSESTHGKTTATFFSVFDPKTRTFEEVVATPRGQRNIADEVAVARAPNGHLVALIRSNVDPTLYQIESTDDGRTWSKGHWTTIPSQFTPADLITLSNGWLLASFSFRERRNERLVVSRDNGATWDVENSADVFDGTMRVGGDRSYPASVQLDAQTIGTVLYETRTPPVGGHIWFVTTPLAALAPPKLDVLYQGDTTAEAAFALWPASVTGRTIEFFYRYTGLLGSPPNVVGLLLDFKDSRNYTAFEYQMGVSRDRRSPTNHVRLVQCVDGQAKTSKAQPARGDWFNDGLVHRMGARQADGQWALTIDGIDQLSVPASLGRPCGIVVRRAAVAVYGTFRSDQSVQTDRRPLDVEVGPIEERPK